MMIDLHGHNVLPEMFNQHPHWGPFLEVGDAGEMNVKVGKWTLHMSTPERKAAIARGEEMPPPEKELERRGDPSKKLAQMDERGVDKLVVSLPLHLVNYHTEPEFAIRYARIANDANAGFVDANPDRLSFWAHVPMQDPEAAVAEAERAIVQLGAKGIGVGGANFGGLEFDDEDYYPLWSKLCELGAPIFVHGYNQSLTWGDAAEDERYEVTSVVGMCYDEARCFWNLVCGGVLDRYPELQVYITHGGGFVPYQLGRFASVNSVLSNVKNKKPVPDYLGNFWFDPLVHDMPMRKAVVEMVGVDRLLYGDNFGGADGVREDLTEGLGLSDADRERIRSGNATKLLGF